MTELASVGDTVVCRCELPTPYTITMKLTTPEQAAEINQDLLSDSPMWELLTQ